MKFKIDRLALFKVELPQYICFIASILIFVSPSFAASIDSLQAGYWYEVPSSQLDSVKADPSPGGVVGVAGVMSAWSGGTFDTNRDRLLVWGGGHSDYAGNEVYAFDINTDTWSRLTEPSTDVAGDPYSGLYPDGKPRAVHSHNYFVYAPNVDKFIVFGGASYYYNVGGIGGSRIVVLDLGAKTPSWDVSSYGNYPNNGDSRGANAIYHPLTGDIWLQTGGSGSLAKFNPLTKTWTTYSNKYVEIYSKASIDTNRNLLVTVGGYGGNRQIFVWDLNHPSSSPSVPATTGATALEYRQAPGFEYDPISQKFVGWDGGASVYVLDPDTWIWSEISPVAENTVTPTEPEVTGTYGRFRYIPSKNAFILVNRTNENVYYYKLTDASGVITEPSVIFNADYLAITQGETALLTWSSYNAASCSASDAWSGDKTVTGSQSVSPIITSTYTLTCAGSGGTKAQSLTITVNEAPPASQSGDTGDAGGGTNTDTGHSSTGSQSGNQSGSGGGISVHVLWLLLFSLLVRITRRNF